MKEILTQSYDKCPIPIEIKQNKTKIDNTKTYIRWGIK